jgi:spore coat protein U-like protein
MGNIMFKKIAIHAGIACLGLTALDAMAADTAQVNVTLQVTAGCQVYVGTPSSSPTPGSVDLDFGSLAVFGQNTVGNDEVEAQTGSGAAGGANVISVACGNSSGSLTPALTLTSGINDAGSIRNLASGSDRIPYTVHSTAARDAASLIENGDAVPLTAAGAGLSTAVLYGKVTTPTAITTAGSYQDTLLLTLTY